MEQEQRRSGAHLFTLRVWEEELGGGRSELRGKVQDIASGEAGYFRDWPGLVALMQRLIRSPEAPAKDTA